ncbi:hypothetical protein ABIE16_001138 [Pseudomonas sp. 2725]|jgi:hypothetical protein
MSLKAPFSPHKKLFYRHASADFAERLSGTEKRTSPRFFAGLHKRDGRPLGARLGTSQQNQLISISTFCMLKFYRKASSRWPLPLHGRFSLRWIGCGRSYVVTVDRYRAAFCPPPAPRAMSKSGARCAYDRQSGTGSTSDAQGRALYRNASRHQSQLGFPDTMILRGYPR